MEQVDGLIIKGQTSRKFWTIRLRFSRLFDKGTGIINMVHFTSSEKAKPQRELKTKKETRLIFFKSSRRHTARTDNHALQMNEYHRTLFG